MKKAFASSSTNKVWKHFGQVFVFKHALFMVHLALTIWTAVRNVSRNKKEIMEQYSEAKAYVMNGERSKE
jgi:putative copper export protein